MDSEWTILFRGNPVINLIRVNFSNKYSAWQNLAEILFSLDKEGVQSWVKFM